MDRKLTITGKTGRYDVPSFVWTENENLVITFDINESRIGRFYASIRCGSRIMMVSLAKYMSVEIPAEFIKKGEFQPLIISLEFRNVDGDKIIVSSDPQRGGYNIEPLRIQRVEENLFVVAWCQEIDKKMETLSARLSEQENKMADIPKQIETAVNEAVVYLTNGDPLKS